MYVFGRGGIMFRDDKHHTNIALYVPAREQVRRFVDIGNVNAKAVRERYGVVNQTPLWRTEGTAVMVYGLMPMELSENRQAIEVYLCEDYVPATCSVYYFVFGDRWIVHGVRLVSEEGLEQWQTSRVDAGPGGVTTEVIEAVSERAISGGRENVCVAVYGSDEMMASVKQGLEPLGVEVVRFESLARARDKKALYVHRDHGLLFLMAAFVALLMFVGSTGYAVKSYFDLHAIQGQIEDLQAQIKQNQQHGRLSNIQNPSDVLKVIQRPMTQRPSSILYAAAEAAKPFGTVTSIDMSTNDMTAADATYTDPKTGKKQTIPGEVMTVMVHVQTDGQPLLVDQEAVAKSVMTQRPWIRFIERQHSGGMNDRDIVLRIGVMIQK